MLAAVDGVGGIHSAIEQATCLHAVALGAKPAVMALLKRAEGDVKHQALLALAKIMTKNYAFVGVGAS